MNAAGKQKPFMAVQHRPQREIHNCCAVEMKVKWMGAVEGLGEREGTMGVGDLNLSHLRNDPRLYPSHPSIPCCSLNSNWSSSPW